MKQPERYVEPRLTQYLFDRASRTLTPLSGTFELSPVCNLACKMCYVRKTPAEVAASPRPPVGLIQFADSALAGAHSENKRILSSGLYLGLKLFSRHWKQEKVSVSQLSVNRLCQLRDFRKVIDKCRSCPPVV